MESFYVSCQDAGRTALILGPFTSESACKQYAYDDQHRIPVLNAVCEIDPKAWFAAWGMVKVADYEKPGFLNRIDPEKWNGILS